MAELVPFFVFCQALGAVGGALAAVWGELAYARAVHDGKIDIAERAHLNAIAKGLTFGMSLLLISSCALILSAYELHARISPALTASYWTFIALALLIIGLTWALSRRRISFSIGSASAFTAWWFLAYLTLGRLPELSFGAAVGLYVVATVVLYAILHYARMLITPKS